MLKLVIVTLVVALVFTTACRVSLDGGDGTGTDHEGVDAMTGVDAAPPSPSCVEATQHDDLAWIQTNVFDKSCVFGGCHKSPASTAGHLSLEDGESHDQLVGVTAETADGWKRVVAGSPEMSYFLVAVGSIPGPQPAGGLMPLASPELCAEKRAALERWVMAGALP